MRTSVPPLVGGIALVVAVGLIFMYAPEKSLDYRKPTFPAENKNVTVLFGGDMMFDRSVRVAAQAHGEDFIFSCIKDVLADADLVVANLEGPITERASRSVGSVPGDLNNTRFTFATSVAPLLKRSGIDVVSLANNHAQDFSADGVRSTMQFLDDAGVGHFGDPLAEHAFTARLGDMQLAFIGYNAFQTLHEDVWLGSTTTQRKIAEAKAAGFLPVVFAHWGVEYEAASDEQKALARAWIDAGAELVVGAHPHVIQEHEIYQEKYIYYSLGNFIFDQYFSEEVRNGLLIAVEFTSDGVASVKEIPIRLERDRRTCPVR